MKKENKVLIDFHLGDILLVWPVQSSNAVAVGLVSSHGDRHVVVAVKHDRQWQNKVHSNHSHGVRDEWAEEGEEIRALSTAYLLLWLSSFILIEKKMTSAVHSTEAGVILFVNLINTNNINY